MGNAEADRQAVPDVDRADGYCDLRHLLFWAIITDAGTASIDVEPVLSLSSLLNVRDAVRMGVGAARLPISLVGRDIASGKMVQWGDVQGSEIGLWALYPSRRLLSARVSAFLEHLKAAFPSGLPEELSDYVDG